MAVNFSLRFFCMFLPLTSLSHLNVCASKEGSESIIRLRGLIAPQPAKEGTTIEMHCDWQVIPTERNTKSKGYYQIKWTKDGSQLFKISSKGEKTKYPFTGVDIDKKDSNEKVVVLKNVTREYEGDYTCEVMGEKPTFRTMNVTTRLTVVELPDTPMLFGAADLYRTDDVMNVSCRAEHARPAANIVFRVNGKEVSHNSGRVRSLKPRKEKGGGFTSEAILTMPVKISHQPTMRLSCQARVMELVVETVKNLRVEDRPHILARWFGSGSNIVTALYSLTVLSLLLSLVS